MIVGVSITPIFSNVFVVYIPVFVTVAAHVNTVLEYSFLLVTGPETAWEIALPARDSKSLLWVEATFPNPNSQSSSSNASGPPPPRPQSSNSSTNTNKNNKKAGGEEISDDSRPTHVPAPGSSAFVKVEVVGLFWLGLSVINVRTCVQCFLLFLRDVLVLGHP